jgi:hypothetical protein
MADELDAVAAGVFARPIRLGSFSVGECLGAASGSVTANWQDFGNVGRVFCAEQEVDGTCVLGNAIGVSGAGNCHDMLTSVSSHARASWAEVTSSDLARAPSWRVLRPRADRPDR